MHGGLAVHVDGDAITPTALTSFAVPSSTIHGRESPADVARAASTTANLVTGRYPPSPYLYKASVHPAPKSQTNQP
jgi:hypothetical protein